MSKRGSIMRRAGAQTSVAGSSPSAAAARSVGKVADPEATGEIALPRDHPKWTRDRFTISATTKALLERIKPAIVRVLSFWDHRTHRLAIDGATIEVDQTGSYRCDSRTLDIEKRAN
jgi:hypothetical protein